MPAYDQRYTRIRARVAVADDHGAHSAMNSDQLGNQPKFVLMMIKTTREPYVIR
jgi:hypothetical protein